MIVALFFQRARFLFAHEGPDGFGGMAESRILRIHFHLGQHGRRADRDAAVQHLLPHGVLQVVADISLAHCHTDRQRARNILLRIGARQFRHGVLDHPHLGTVAVADHHLVAVLDQVHDRPRRDLHGLHLFRQVISQGVPAQGNHDPLSHRYSSHFRETRLPGTMLRTACGVLNAYFWKNRAVPRSSSAFRVAWGSFTLARKIIAAMM